MRNRAKGSCVTRWLTYASDDLSKRPAVLALKTRAANPPTAPSLLRANSTMPRRLASPQLAGGEWENWIPGAGYDGGQGYPRAACPYRWFDQVAGAPVRNCAVITHNMACCQQLLGAMDVKMLNTQMSRYAGRHTCEFRSDKWFLPRFASQADFLYTSNRNC